MNHLAAALALFLTTLAQAHEGHGIEGASHWHATDTLMPLLLGAAVGLAVWFGRRK